MNSIPMTPNKTHSDSSTVDLMEFPHFPERRRSDDPFADLVHPHSVTSDAPMVKLDFHVTIQGGLAFVKSKRTYINKSDGPIEAVMSLPVSVHAAFFGLSAEIGGKHYNAQAKPKQDALETYEEAMDEGKAAVLHEELLRGIHSLSVGNLGAGKTVRVTTRWVELLRFHNDVGYLRIPLTVGDVYGISPMEDVDTLTTGGLIPEATLHIQYDGECIELHGGSLRQGDVGEFFVSIPGNAPIELKVSDVVSSKLIGTSTDGRSVSVNISPHGKQGELLNVAVLVDRSGSMNSSCIYSGGSSESQHEAVVRGLREVQPLLVDKDHLALWEFDTDCDRVGKLDPVNSEKFRKMLARLGSPRGGTSIGKALEQVCVFEEGKDILLITDGQSYDLNVQKLVRAGHRVYVVLVGESSLEAMVGHLAVLSGGDIHFSFGADVGQAIQACIQGMRQKRIQDARCELGESGLPEYVRIARNNASIEVSWSQVAENPEVGGEFSEAVAAFAASLAFAGAEEEWADKIAIQAGLITHLTSLVLVADDAPIQEDLPRTVKQALPASREMRLCASAPSKVAIASGTRAGICYSPVAGKKASIDHVFYATPEVDSHRQIHALLGEQSSASSHAIDWNIIVRLSREIDWKSAGPKLARGFLDGVSEEVIKEIMNLVGEVKYFADQLGMPPQILIIALAAYAVQDSSKWAARVYRRIIRGYDQTEFERIALDLCFIQ